MKSTSWIIMLAVLFSIGFIACNNSRIKNYAEANPKAAVALTPLPGNEIFTCTMHNEVMSAHPGECSKCGMTLVKQPFTAAQEKMIKEETFIKVKE